MKFGCPNEKLVVPDRTTANSADCAHYADYGNFRAPEGRRETGEAGGRGWRRGGGGAEQPPHAVVAIDGLVDNRFVKQGDPGYSNPIVHVGDRILAVDGRPAEHVSVQELHGISLL